MDDKKKQLHRWFSEEELKVLSELANEKEIVKISKTYPDLYSQMYYAMADISGFKNNITSEIQAIAREVGFAEVAEILLDSIPLFISSELGIKDCLQEMEPEQCINAESLMALQNSVYSRVGAAKHFLKIECLNDRIREKKKVTALAVSRILI